MSRPGRSTLDRLRDAGCCLCGGVPPDLWRQGRRAVRLPGEKSDMRLGWWREPQSRQPYLAAAQSSTAGTPTLRPCSGRSAIAAPGLSDPPTKRSRGGPSGTGVAARSSDVEKEKAVRKALSSLRNRPSQGQPAALAELKAGLTRSMARAVLRSRRQPRARREQVVGSDEGRSIFRRRALRRPFFSTCRHGSRCTAKPSARLPA